MQSEINILSIPSCCGIKFLSNVLFETSSVTRIYRHNASIAVTENKIATNNFVMKRATKVCTAYLQKKKGKKNICRHF